MYLVLFFFCLCVWVACFLACLSLASCIAVWTYFAGHIYTHSASVSNAIAILHTVLFFNEHFFCNFFASSIQVANVFEHFRSLWTDVKSQNKVDFLKNKDNPNFSIKFIHCIELWMQFVFSRWIVSLWIVSNRIGPFELVSAVTTKMRMLFIVQFRRNFAFFPSQQLIFE